MNTLNSILIIAAIVAVLSLPLFISYRKRNNMGSAKKALLLNLGSYAFIFLIACVVPLVSFAAPEAAAEGAKAVATGMTDAGMGYLAAALAVGLSGIGGGIAVSGAASAAIGAIAEDKKSFGLALVFVALAEGVALYGLLIAFQILAKL